MFKYKEKTGEKLKEEARRLGLSEEGWYEHAGTVRQNFREAMLQGCVREAKRARRENWYRVIAIIASIFGVITAWVAILK